MATPTPIRIGYVPEHFSTPLHYAQKYFGLTATLIPFPSGTGHMITSLRANEIDVAIGLTEGWVAGLGKDGVEGDGGYRIVGQYVDTPLCWAISTGATREINTTADLKTNNKIGVSRIGSGSYVMGYVLADQNSWLTSNPHPYSIQPLQTFAALRTAVNDGSADFFMWEHFTSKKYYDNGEIKRIGEIYTPWPSWQIVASTSTTSRPTSSAALDSLFEALDKGIDYFNKNPEESVKYISTSLDYSEEDAREWLKTVKFAGKTRGVDGAVVEKTIGILKKAGVIGEEGMKGESMIGIKA